MKRLLLLICLLQAGTIAPMFDETTAFEPEKKVVASYDAEATEKYHKGNLSKDDAFTLCLQKPWLIYPEAIKEEKIAIDLDSISKPVSNNLLCINVKQIMDSQSDNKRNVELWFASDDDYRSFVWIAQKKIEEKKNKEFIKKLQNGIENNTKNLEEIKKLQAQNSKLMQEIDYKFIPCFTYDAAGTNLYYNRKYVHFRNDSFFVINVASKNRITEQILIDIANFPEVKKDPSNDVYSIEVTQLTTSGKQLKIELEFKSKTEYEQLKDIAAQRGYKEAPKNHNATQQKSSFYQKLTLGFIGCCAVGFGIFALYKYPQPFMNNIMGFIRSFKFPFAR